MIAHRLALGTAQIGFAYGIANQSGQVTRADAKTILAKGRSGGLNTLDTAISYGESETRLGEIGIAGWRVVSKLPTLPDNCLNVAQWVEQQLFGSLQRLGIDRLYGLLVHNPRQLLGPSGVALAAALCEIRKTGLVERIGLSIYAPDELEMTYSLLQPDLVQAPLNLIDRRLVDSGWLQRLADDGVEVHTRSAFLQGLLLMPELPARFAPWSALWSCWQAWQAAHPNRAIAACLAYPLFFPQVTRVVVGIDSLTQLSELLAAMHNLPAAVELPDLRSSDQRLINPALWNSF